MAHQEPSPEVDSERAPIRWWPAWIVVLAAATAVTTIRLWPKASFQQKNIWTAQAVFYALVLVLVWIVALSRLRRRTRLLAVAVMLGLIGTSVASLRIRGVSGDLVPILEWRFNSSRANSLTTRPQKGPAAPAEVKHGSGTIWSTNDYPQFQGPHRNGVLEGPQLARNWEARPPRLLWRHAVGPGWSGFAIIGGRAITMEQRGEEESVTCYDLGSGKLLWAHSDAAHYNTTIAGEGPRTTPTIQGTRGFTMGATGILNALDLSDGHVLWTKNVPKALGGSVGEWGASCSPLVHGDAVIVTTGAASGHSLAAFHCSNGEQIWTGGDDRGSYSSPVAATLAGTAQILSFHSSSVIAVDAANGQQLWKHPWPTGHPHIATPLVLEGDRVLVSSGYGTGSELLQITRTAQGQWTARRLWKSNRLKSKFANLIERAGYIYGLDDGILTCLDAGTGQLVWKEGRYGHGQLIALGDLLLVMAENGQVVLIAASPKEPKVLTRFAALGGKTWNPPALAGPYLLVRNDLEAACFALPTL